MAVRKEVFRFEASARLQRLFGRELMPDDDSALEELVKNAYDSNASRVEISIVRPSAERDGEIEIRDNGLGLTKSEFKRVWMKAGYSEKTGQPLPGTGRIQVGEKGIGRFAADRLGSRLLVLTKTRDSKRTLRVRFDWLRFDDKRRLLSDIAIPYDYVEEASFESEESGTILRISGLRSSWTDKEVDRLRRHLGRMLNPYDAERGFKIRLTAPTPKLSGPVVPSEIQGADFEWDIARKPQGKVRIRLRTREAEGSGKWGDWHTTTISDPAPENPDEDFGAVAARILFFVDRPKKANVGDNLPGIAVFRDGLRVEPAGSTSADWLGLLEKRAKRAGHMPLVPSRLFGFVQIGRDENPALRDATNRRAFISGPQVLAFRRFLQSRLTELERQVEKDVSKPKWEKSRQLKSQKLLQARHKTLSVMSLSLAHELRQPLQAIKTASENIVGHLNEAQVSIPEIDSATEVISRNVGRIDKHIRFLKSVGSGNTESEQFGAVGAIDSVVEVFATIAEALGVSLTRDGETDASVYCNEPTLLAALTNLVHNALQAIQGHADGHRHTVKIQTLPVGSKTVIRVVDDGPGIPEAVRPRLFKRQTTSTQGGMGVGLLVWREALEMSGGSLTCESFGAPTIFTISVPAEASTNGENSPG